MYSSLFRYSSGPSAVYGHSLDRCSPLQFPHMGRLLSSLHLACLQSPHSGQLHQENITKIFLLCICWNSLVSGRIITSPAGPHYFECLSPGRHGRQPVDSWRNPAETERRRETLEALAPFSKYFPDAASRYERGFLLGGSPWSYLRGSG